MKKIGLVAGNGKFPVYFAKEASKKGIDIYSVLLEDEADRNIEGIVKNYIWLSPGKLSGILKFFKKNGIKEVVLAGQVKHRKLFEIRPDVRAMKLLFSIKDRKADTILKALTDEFKKEGINILSSITFLEDKLVKEMVYTKKRPSRKDYEDIEFGYRIAKKIGEVDIGQTVVVKEKAVIAVEAMEGTDECIKRAGEITNEFTVVKTAKPKQDLRFDVPVIGKRTIEVLIEAKGKVLAVEAGKTLFFDEEEAVDIADKNGIIIVGVKY